MLANLIKADWGEWESERLLRMSEWTNKSVNPDLFQAVFRNMVEALLSGELLNEGKTGGTRGKKRLAEGYSSAGACAPNGRPRIYFNR